MIREHSISTLIISASTELPVGTASRITNLTSESDSHDLDSNDGGIIEISSVANLIWKRKYFVKHKSFCKLYKHNINIYIKPCEQHNIIQIQALYWPPKAESIKKKKNEQTDQINIKQQTNINTGQDTQVYINFLIIAIV